HHHSPRRIRFLAHDLLLETPILGEMLRGFGSVPATFEVGQKLLENDELVFFYPEGARGTGKLFSQRYRLCDFDPGFVKAAIATNSPIIPITTLGAEEIYPILFESKTMARLLHWPYFPVTPSYPLLPWIASAIPIPTKFLMMVGKPIYLNYPPQKATNKKLRL